jgi:hypothetical protein
MSDESVYKVIKEKRRREREAAEMGTPPHQDVIPGQAIASQNGGVE